MGDDTKLGMLEKHVCFANHSKGEVRVTHPMLPNGGIVVPAGAVTYMPAQVWSVKWRTPGLKRATEEEKAAGCVAQPVAPEPVIPEPVAVEEEAYPEMEDEDEV